MMGRRTLRTIALPLAALSLLVGCSTTEIASGTEPPVSVGASAAGAAAADVSAAETGRSTEEPVEAENPVATAPVPSTAAEVSEPAPLPVTVVPLSGWAAVDQYLEATIVRGGSSAASVAVFRNGELQHQAAYGQRVAGDPAEPDLIPNRCVMKSTCIGTRPATLKWSRNTNLPWARNGRTAT